MPVDVVGTLIDIYTCICVYGNGGTNAGERFILAVSNYDDYIIKKNSSVTI